MNGQYQTELRARVIRGSLFLRKVHPRRLDNKIEVESIDESSPSKCVVGQLVDRDDLTFLQKLRELDMGFDTAVYFGLAEESGRADVQEFLSDLWRIAFSDKASLREIHAHETR